MNYICHSCGKGFKFKSKLAEHNKRKNPCSTQQNVPQNQNVTQENQHNVPQEKQQNVEESQCKNTCTDCGKVFKTKWLLNRHKKTCKGHDSLTCKFCSKVFSSAKTRWKHEYNRSAACLAKESVEKPKVLPPEDSFKSKKTSVHSVYLLIEREFFVTMQNIFKIGRSANVSNRTRQYPKGSQLLVVLPCNDSILTESRLKRVFSEKFIQRNDIGSEYYEGPPDTIIKEFVANVALHF